MILIGVGSNLKSKHDNLPKDNCIEAIRQLSLHTIYPTRTSSFYETSPIPYKNLEPWYINSVVIVETTLNPFNLLKALLKIELKMGRNRTWANAPRVIDLDLLAYDDQKIGEAGLILPHPRLHERAFVLKPLEQIAPNWLHPVTGKSIKQLVKNLDPHQIVRPISCGSCLS